MIVSGIPDSEALASAVWALAEDECRLCQLALMWLILNKRRISGGRDNLAEICRGLVKSDLLPASKEKNTNDVEGYGRMLDMARSVLLGETVDPTFGAWRSHRHSAAPGWSLGLSPTALIGPFLFYAPALPGNEMERDVLVAHI